MNADSTTLTHTLEGRASSLRDVAGNYVPPTILYTFAPSRPLSPTASTTSSSSSIMASPFCSPSRRIQYQVTGRTLIPDATQPARRNGARFCCEQQWALQNGCTDDLQAAQTRNLSQSYHPSTRRRLAQVERTVKQRHATIHLTTSHGEQRIHVRDHLPLLAPPICSTLAAIKTQAFSVRVPHTWVTFAMDDLRIACTCIRASLDTESK